MTVDTNAWGADLAELVGKLAEPEILVLGDLMLDRYVWGDAERISQEAPVMLLRADRREERLGGASSVSMMLSHLGARVKLAGVVGEDDDARRVRSLLEGMNIDHATVLADDSRPTTVKERYIGRAQQKHPQQVLRVDYEKRAALDAEVEGRLSEALESALATAEIVLVSDYDKGVCTPGLLNKLTKACKKRGIRILVDPTRGGDYGKYQGMSTMTPNRLEAGLATGRVLDSIPEALRAARQLRTTLGLEAGIVTLDKEGMALDTGDGDGLVFPVRPRQVYDITGWKWKKLVSPRSAGKRSCRIWPGPGMRHGPPSRWRSKICYHNSTCAAWVAGAWCSPTAASTCCMLAMCNIWPRRGPRATCWW